MKFSNPSGRLSADGKNPLSQASLMPAVASSGRRRRARDGGIWVALTSPRLTKAGPYDKSRQGVGDKPRHRPRLRDVSIGRAPWALEKFPAAAKSRDGMNGRLDRRPGGMRLVVNSLKCRRMGASRVSFNSARDHRRRRQHRYDHSRSHARPDRHGRRDRLLRGRAAVSPP